MLSHRPPQRTTEPKGEKKLKQANMDESFRRPGRIPFEWEIQPGVPKPHHRSIAAASPPPPASSKLNPPPRMASPSRAHHQSPSSLSKSRSQSYTCAPVLMTPKLGGPPPYKASSSPSPSRAATTVFYRSASASPSKRRGHPAHQQSANKAPVLAPQVTSVPLGCFPVPSLRRKDHKKSMNRGSGVEMAVSAPRDSVSSGRSSASFSSPFRRSLVVRDEAEVAARWFF